MKLLHTDTPGHAHLPSLEERAASDLDYIRSTLDRAGRFTPVPGLGGIFMGLVALVTTATSNGQTNQDLWLFTWLVAAALAFIGGTMAMQVKAEREEVPLFGSLGRKFLLGLAPPLAAGAILTALLWRADATHLLPAVWLLTYGAACITGGAFSVAVVPIMGAVFMALGLVAALVPPSFGTLLLGLGFGGAHIIFGAWIARHHGG